MNTPSQQAEPTDAQAMNIAFKAFGYADHETFCAGWRAKADHVFDTQAAAVAQPTAGGRISIDEEVLVSMFISLVAGVYVAIARPEKADLMGAEVLVRETLEQVKRF